MLSRILSAFQTSFWFAIVALIFMTACPSGTGAASLSSEGVNDPVQPYGADRAEQLEGDLGAIWQRERTAGEWYSSIMARGAARRVFNDMNLHFKGTSADVINYLSREPVEQTKDKLIYKITAPTYTDIYTVILVNDTFQKVERNRIQRMRFSR